MSADYARVHRILKMITLFQSEGGWNVARLAELFDVGDRTIYRDLSVMADLGIPCYHDAGEGGYRIRRDFFMPPLSLTAEEALALVALGQAVAEQEQIPLLQPAARAITKVRARMPARVQDELGDADQHVDVHLPPTGPTDGIADVYETVRRAIASRRTLRCRYESLEARNDVERQQEEFDLEPYRLLFARRAWYVIGHHAGRDARRTLKLNRFTDIELTERRYTIPEDFSLDDHLGKAWSMIRGETTHDIELWFDPEFAETIADTQWHPTQTIDWHDDGSITLRYRVEGLDEIVWWVLSMGPHCIVKQPPELAERVRTLGRQMLAHYEHPGGY